MADKANDVELKDDTIEAIEASSVITRESLMAACAAAMASGNVSASQEAMQALMRFDTGFRSAGKVVADEKPPSIPSRFASLMAGFKASVKDILSAELAGKDAQAWQFTVFCDTHRGVTLCKVDDLAEPRAGKLYNGKVIIGLVARDGTVWDSYADYVWERGEGTAVTYHLPSHLAKRYNKATASQKDTDKTKPLMLLVAGQDKAKLIATWDKPAAD